MVQNRITDSECQSSETTNMVLERLLGISAETQVGISILVFQENSYPVLLKICERNIQVLRTVFPECGKVNREIPEYVALAGKKT